MSAEQGGEVADLVARLEEKKIDEIFASINQSHLPGAAVAVAIEGRPVYRKAFGLANIELPAALSTSMRMRVGSSTKHFACLAFMLLCEQGLADPDDEIGKFLPELHEASRHVTMRQLMGHTSGLRDIFPLTMLFHGPGRPITDKEMLAYYEAIDDFDFTPGSHWNYNSGGYVLLSTAIERIADDSLDNVLRTRIFEPVGMHDTMLRRWDSDFVPNSATLHMFTSEGKYSRDYMGMELTGAGGMVSTMEDMLVWLKHMDAPHIGSATTWDLMKTPQRLPSGASTGYGLGLILSPYRGALTVQHGGGVMGGNSQMIKIPAAKLDISVAVNRADLSAAVFANQIIDACVDGLDVVPPIGPSSERPHQIFVSRKTGSVAELISHAGMQLVSIDGAPAMPMSPDSEGVLRLPALVAYLQQHIIPSATSIRVFDFGREEEFALADYTPDAKLGAHTGSFENDIFDVQAIIWESEEGARMKTIGRHGAALYSLAPLSGAHWKATPIGPVQALGFVVMIDTDGFTIRPPRGSNIRFRRASAFTF